LPRKGKDNHYYKKKQGCAKREQTHPMSWSKKKTGGSEVQGRPRGYLLGDR